MAESRLLASDQPFDPGQRATLRALAGTMVPADPGFGVPGADDPLIQADLAGTLRSVAPAVHAALARLDAIAGPFTALDADARLAVAERFRTGGDAAASLLIGAVLQCYYRDDRVMRALGMEPRPPFPRGYPLPDGELATLLAPVRARAPFWRRAPDR